MATKKYLTKNLEEATVLIIDEISMLHRKQLDAVNTILKYFKNLSILLNLGVIITNQVTANPDPFGAKIKPIGGHIMGHYVKYIWWISKGMKNNRLVRLEKSPSHPTGDYKCFVNEEGISQYEKLTNKIRDDRIKHIADENGSTKRTDLLDD